MKPVLRRSRRWHPWGVGESMRRWRGRIVGRPRGTPCLRKCVRRLPCLRKCNRFCRLLVLQLAALHLVSDRAVEHDRVCGAPHFLEPLEEDLAFSSDFTVDVGNALP